MAIKNRSNQIGKIITVKVGRRDKKKSRNYLNNCKCVLATALARMFPGKKIEVWGTDLKIGRREYLIENFVRVQHLGYPEEYTHKPFEPFTVVLHHRVKARRHYHEIC